MSFMKSSIFQNTTEKFDRFLPKKILKTRYLLMLNLAGQKSIKFFGGILENRWFHKRHSQIIWPLQNDSVQQGLTVYKRCRFFHNSQSESRLDYFSTEELKIHMILSRKLIPIIIFYFRCVNHFACSSCDQKMTVKTKFYEVDLKPVCKVSTYCTHYSRLRYFCPKVVCM